MRVLNKSGMTNRTYEIGNYVIKAPVFERKGLSGAKRGLYMGILLFLEKKYPQLREFEFSSDQTDSKTLVKLYHSLLPLWNEAAAEVHLRNTFMISLGAASSDSLKKEIAVEIAKSNLKQGIADRARILLRHEDTRLAEAEAKQIEKLESAYGAKYLSWVDWEYGRGETLRLYYSSHKDHLKGKRILHFAPELELHDFIRSESARLGIHYRTADAFRENVDYRVDICIAADSIPETFDIIIIHRVLEHILDDKTAISNLNRLLRPGGHIHHSVPMSCSEKTLNWDLPDDSHDGHVRQYGSDYIQMFDSEGLETTVVEWLLTRSREEYIENRAYPMRTFISRRPSS